MRQALVLVFIGCSTVSLASAQEQPKAVVTGLTNPESVLMNPQGQVFVSVIGEGDRDGDGTVLKIDQGKAVPFATGLDDPKGLARLLTAGSSWPTSIRSGGSRRWESGGLRPDVGIPHAAAVPQRPGRRCRERHPLRK